MLLIQHQTATGDRRAIIPNGGTAIPVPPTATSPAPSEACANR